MNTTANPPRLERCAVLPALRAPQPRRSESSARPGAEERRKPHPQGRFAVLNAFVDGTLRSLSHSEAAVWLVLYRDEKNGLSRVSQKSIAERAGVCERTARRLLAKLAARGLVEMVRRGRLGQGASAYRIRPTPKS